MRLNGRFRITFEAGRGQVAEMVSRYIVTTGTGKMLVYAVIAGRGAVILV